MYCSEKFFSLILWNVEMLVGLTWVEFNLSQLHDSSLFIVLYDGDFRELNDPGLS